MHCTGIPHLIVLCRYSDFFTNWKFMASLLVPFFQQHLLPYVSVSHFDNSCNNFKHFHYYCYICYGDLWWVIFDVTIVIVLECHEPHPQKMVNLTDKCCVCSDYSIHWPFPISLLLFGPPCSLRHNNSEIRSVKAMAPNSSTLAWRLPWTEEPGRLQSMGSRRVGHNWSDLAATASHLSEL